MSGFVIREYLLPATGICPYREWLKCLDRPIAQRIQARILRFETGNLGDYKAVGGGVYEARLNFGSGFRLYFGMQGLNIVVLLCGGDKGSQGKDIRKAVEYWKTYLEDKYD